MIQNLYGLALGCQTTTIRPTLPDDFAASGTDNTHVVLTWTDASGIECVQLEWSTSDANYLPLIELYPDENTYSHAGRTKNVTYYYRYRCKCKNN
jgi:hypothetical protein